MEIITEKTKKLNEQVVKAEVNLGENLQEAIAIHGEEKVYNAYLASAVIRARAKIVAYAISGLDKAAIEAKMADWKLDQGRVTGEAGLGSLLKKFEKLSPDKQKELIAKLLASSGEAE